MQMCACMHTCVLETDKAYLLMPHYGHSVAALQELGRTFHEFDNHKAGRNPSHFQK